MRIVALENHPEHVSFRYRIDAFRRAFEAEGHEVIYRPWPTWWLGWSASWSELRRADVVVIQRRLLPGWKLDKLRRVSRNLVFDFDDAIFLRDSFDPRGPECDHRRERFVRMIRVADAVVTGNRFLHREALLWKGPASTYHVPTCVDAERYRQARHLCAGAGVQLAWIGSASTLRGLERIRETLEELGKSQPGLSLAVICDRSLALTHLPVRFCPWSAPTETADLAGADIGISWLPADTWSRGKCGLKVLQYMAAGLPVVANPVGIQTELVRHGETGFLAETQEQWHEAIRLLAGDPELRRRLGAAGRRRVCREFHIQQGAAAWLDLLETLRHNAVAASVCP